MWVPCDTVFLIADMGPGGQVTLVEKIKAEVYKRGPVSCGIHVTKGFSQYKGGVYQEHVAKPEANHELSIVGWGHSAGVG
jgi:cathepsin X